MESDMDFEFYFKVNGSVDLLFLDDINLGYLLLNQSFIPYSVIFNLSERRERWNSTFLNQSYGIPIDSTTKSKIVQNFYLAIKNNGNSVIHVYITMNSQSFSIQALADTSRLWLMVMMSVLSTFLFIKSRQLHREGEDERAHMLRGYSIGFGFGFWNYAISELNNYFQDAFNFEMFPAITRVSPILQISLDMEQLITSILFGVTLFFIVFEIESHLGKFKHAYISHNIAFSLLGVMIGFIVPITMDIMMIWFGLSLVIGIFYFISIYSQVIINTSGKIQGKAIIIIVGVILTFFMGALRNTLIPAEPMISNLIGDSLSILGLILFYYGAI
jgi:hypothetical protein